nr:nitroreductase family protein [Frankia sp. R43]
MQSSGTGPNGLEPGGGDPGGGDPGGMGLREAMRTSGAERTFTEEPVPDEVLARVLDDARFAPSGANAQPWTVIVLRDPEIRRGVRELSVLGWREYRAQVKAGLRPFAPGPDGRWHGPGVDLAEAAATPQPMTFIDNLDRAPVLLVLCARLTALAVADVDLDRQSIVGGGSVYPFAQNVLLAARAEGLGGVLTTFLVRREPAAAKLLAIPADHAIAGVIALGYPQRRATRLTRRPVEEFARLDTFDGPAFPGPASRGTTL